MGQVKISDRRVSHSHRERGAYAYTGPERRTGHPVIVCICCGKICVDYRGLSQDAPALAAKVECRSGLCADCTPV